jgi:hypothetical protein
MKGTAGNDRKYLSCQSIKWYNFKYDEDALHLAVGIFYEVDYLASWNFKHIVKVKTKRMVTSIAIREGYKGLQIISPTEVLENG